MSAAKLNIDELEAGYPLFCKALRLLILKGNSVKDIEKTVCWGHLETLNRCLPGRYKAPTYLMALIKRDIAKPCLLYTSPSPRDRTRSRMPSSA